MTGFVYNTRDNAPAGLMRWFYVTPAAKDAEQVPYLQVSAAGLLDYGHGPESMGILMSAHWLASQMCVIENSTINKPTLYCNTVIQCNTSQPKWGSLENYRQLLLHAVTCLHCYYESSNSQTFASKTV